MRLETIVLENEVLDGKALDEINYWIGTDLASENILPSRMTVVREEDLKAEIQFALARKSNVLIVVCEFRPLVDDRALVSISEAIKKRLVPEARISAAVGQDPSKTPKAKNFRVPENADLIKNPSGSALGLKIRTERGIIYVLPKKIDELRFMLKNSVVPELKSPSS